MVIRTIISDTVKEDFSKIGDENNWFVFKRLGLMPYKEIKSRIKAQKFAQQNINTGNANTTLSKILDDLDSNFEFNMSLISDWSFVDVNGNKLPLPSINKDIWQDIPGIYLTHMMKTIQEDAAGSNFLGDSLSKGK